MSFYDLVFIFSSLLLHKPSKQRPSQTLLHKHSQTVQWTWTSSDTNYWKSLWWRQWKSVLTREISPITIHWSLCVRWDEVLSAEKWEKKFKTYLIIFDDELFFFPHVNQLPQIHINDASLTSFCVTCEVPRHSFCELHFLHTSHIWRSTILYSNVNIKKSLCVVCICCGSGFRGHASIQHVAHCCRTKPLLQSGERAGIQGSNSSANL